MLGLLDQGDDGSSREVSKAEWVNLRVTVTHECCKRGVSKKRTCLWALKRAVHIWGVFLKISEQINLSKTQKR